MQGVTGSSDMYQFFASGTHSAGPSPRIVPGSSFPRSVRLDPGAARSSTTPSSPLTANGPYATEYFDPAPTTSTFAPTAQQSLQPPTQHRFQYSPSQPMSNPVPTHKLSEPPAHTLFVRNLSNSVEEREITDLFGRFGELNKVYFAQARTRGFVMVTYYDIRESMEAMRCLQGFVLHGKHMDIHYGIPKDNPSEEEQNNGTLFVRNLDQSVTNDDIYAKFQKYGPIREVRSTPGKRGHRFVEFFDTRDAKNAMDSENNTMLRGTIITIELSRPGGQYQRLLRHGHTPQQQQQQQQQQMYEEQAYLSPLSSSNTNSLATQFPPAPLPLEHHMTAMNGTLSNGGGRSMPLSVPDCAQLSPRAPKQQQLFSKRSRSRVGQQTADRFATTSESASSYSSLSSQHLATTMDEMTRTQVPQHPILQRESVSSHTLTRSYNPGIGSPLFQQPAVYTPPGSYSPGLFAISNGSGSSSCSTSTPSSTVDTTVPLPMALNYSGGPMTFLSPPTPVQAQRSPKPQAQASTQPHPQAQQVTQQPQMEFLTPSSFGMGAKTSSPLHLGSTSPSPSPLLNSCSPQTCSPGVEPGPSSLSPSPAPTGDPAYDIVLKDGVATDSRTTLYIKNIPHRVNPTTFLSVMMSICPNGFRFLYLPNSKQNPRSNNGYAFIKLISTESVPAVVSALNFKQWPRYNTEKICEVKYATVQSFNDLLRQFDSSPLLSDRDRWRPFVLYNGEYTPLTTEIFTEVRTMAQTEKGEEGESSPAPVVTKITPTTTVTHFI